MMSRFSAVVNTTLLALVTLLTWSGVMPVQADDMMQRVADVSPFPITEYQDIELFGDRAYIFGVGGVAIIDLDGYAVVGYYNQVDPPVRFFRGVVSSSHVYAGAREDGLYVIDITSETSPQQATVYNVQGPAYEGMAVRDGFLFAARHGEGLEILDVSDPADPLPVAALTRLTNSWDVAFRDDYLLVADGAGGLAVVDITDPSLAHHLNSVPTTGSAVDVEIEDNLGLVALGSAGVDVFDVTNPLQIQWLGNYNSSGLAMGVAAVGDTLFIADWDDIEVVELTFPQSPSLLGWEKPVIFRSIRSRLGPFTSR
jgi:hypothetical protein